MKARQELRAARLPQGNAWQCPGVRRRRPPVFLQYLAAVRDHGALDPEVRPRICRVMRAAWRQPVSWRRYAFVGPFRQIAYQCMAKAVLTDNRGPPLTQRDPPKCGRRGA